MAYFHQGKCKHQNNSKESNSVGLDYQKLDWGWVSKRFLGLGWIRDSQKSFGFGSDNKHLSITESGCN